MHVELVHVVSTERGTVHLFEAVIFIVLPQDEVVDIECEVELGYV